MEEFDYYEPDEPPAGLLKNKAGRCALCDRELGFYDSKFIEVEGVRLVCAVSCLSFNNPHWPKGYRYWTDG